LFPLRRAEALTLGTHIVESMVDTPQVSIKLVSPRDVEEGGTLDVDGATPAGATM
jgi:hypothetical protein